MEEPSDPGLMVKGVGILVCPREEGSVDCRAVERRLVVEVVAMRVDDISVEDII